MGETEMKHSLILFDIMIATMLVVMMVGSGSALSLGGVEKCDPSIIPRLPPRMKTICLSLLRTIQEYDEILESPEPPPAMEYFVQQDKRKDPDHVFLRFG